MATASKNGHEGLSRARDSRNLELCAVKTKWENAQNDIFHLVHRAIWENTMDSAPLIKRGTVLQERVLSPRSLHSCESELFWECREFGSESHKKMCLVDGISKNKKEVAYDRWKAWICLYSQACLTKGSDRLVAISALTKLTRTALDDIYVAGLWRYKFADELVWYAYTGCPPPTDHEYRAPSWSWASFNGAIFLCYHPAK